MYNPTAPPSYVILDEGRAIRCRLCGLTSWNQHDVGERYCGHCKVYHEDAEAAAAIATGGEGAL